MPPDLSQQRKEYRLAGLTEANLAATWLAQFRLWLTQAAGVREPTACVLGTATAAGVPSARSVLLKGVDERGFVVFTNYTSRKGREATANPSVSLVFPWYEIERQVVVAGRVSRLPREETEAYFRSRPRASQISAWASHQSAAVARSDLESRAAELTQRWQDRDVPVPEFWGGLLIAPLTVEFWQGRASRLHDRLCYEVATGALTRLSP